MTKLKLRVIWLACCAIVVLLWSCTSAPVTPKDATQTLYATGWTLVGATNSVADMHDSGVLKGEDYTTAKNILKEATDAYKSGKAAFGQGKTSDATTYIRLAQTALNKLAAYLAAKEAK